MISSPQTLPSDPLKGSDLLAQLLRADMDMVNAAIAMRVKSHVHMIPDIARHLISSGGKRLRPLLTLAFAKMSGCAGPGHQLLAASVEFMHTATLLHDDVVDESDMRRGKASAHKLWGNQASVLVGDFLLGEAFQMMVEAGSLPALKILSSASVRIAEGEVMQLAAVDNLESGKEHYMTVIDAKTATLFAAACEVGPALAGFDQELQEHARIFGQKLGITFQLVDDVLDYCGDAEMLGKNVGDDFRSGKVTLPLILAFQRADAKTRDHLRRCFHQQDMSSTELEEAIAIIRQPDVIGSCMEEARRNSEIAGRHLERMPESELREAVKETLDYCVERLS